MRPRIKRFLAAMLFVLAGIGVAQDPQLAFAQGEPEYGGNYENYFDWNICQSACDWIDGSLSSVNALADRVINSNRKPRGVAVQEMCRSGFNHLVNRIGNGTNLSYGARFYPAKYNTDACSEVGNAIFFRGDCAWTPDCSSIGEFDAQHINDTSPPNQEVRGYACGFAPDYETWYCSAHITSKHNGDLRVVQANQLSQYRQMSLNPANAFGLPSVMMGDFNVNPWTTGVPIDNWYASHREADRCSSDGDGNPQTGCTRTHDTSNPPIDRKLDYVFAIAGAGMCSRHSPPVDADIGGGTTSDHRFVRGYFEC